jgi:four helix bundle protein
MQRTAVSLMSKSAEGFARHGQREFQPLLWTAKGSWGAVRSQLYVAFDVGYLVKDDFQRLLAQAEEVARVVGGLRASVEKPRDEQRSAS